MRRMDETETVNHEVELREWRKSERKRLIDQRMTLRAEERAALTERIAERLEALIGDPAGLVVSAYWPFRGEPDLKPLLARLREQGAITALPVVVQKAHPLEFRAWKSGDKLDRGVWNIPIPAQGEVVIPDVAIAPVVGFDRQCYRLGYGGGFFDRTLAAMEHLPLVIGVGYSLQSIATIHPQPHDIAMSMIVTETATHLPR